MSDESKEPWLQIRRLRREQAESAPSFERVWRAAESRGQSTPVWHPYRVGLTLAVAAVLLTAALVLMRPDMKPMRLEPRSMEQDFAVVDSTLLLHWQTPTDVLFDTLGGDEPFEP